MNDGNELLRTCNIMLNIVDKTVKDFDYEDAGNSSFCLGFMQGIIGLNSVYESKTDNNNTPLFCHPEGIITGQATRVVVKYLKDHPEQLHNNMITLTILAFKKAFPCKN